MDLLTFLTVSEVFPGIQKMHIKFPRVYISRTSVFVGLLILSFSPSLFFCKNNWCDLTMVVMHIDTNGLWGFIRKAINT